MVKKIWFIERQDVISMAYYMSQGMQLSGLDTLQKWKSSYWPEYKWDYRDGQLNIVDGRIVEVLS